MLEHCAAMVQSYVSFLGSSAVKKSVVVNVFINVNVMMLLQNSNFI